MAWVGRAKALDGGALRRLISYTLSLILCLLLLASLSGAFISCRNVASANEAQSAAAATETPYVPDEVIVAYKQDAATLASTEAEAENEVSLLSQSDAEQISCDTKVYKLQDGVSVEDAVAQLSEDPRIAYAEPNAYVDLAENTSATLQDFFVNDPLAETMQWALVDENAKLEDVWNKVKVQHKVGGGCS